MYISSTVYTKATYPYPAARSKRSQSAMYSLCAGTWSRLPDAPPVVAQHLAPFPRPFPLWAPRGKWGHRPRTGPPIPACRPGAAVRHGGRGPDPVASAEPFLTATWSPLSKKPLRRHSLSVQPLTPRQPMAVTGQPLLEEIFCSVGECPQRTGHGVAGRVVDDLVPRRRLPCTTAAGRPGTRRCRWTTTSGRRMSCCGRSRAATASSSSPVPPRSAASLRSPTSPRPQ